MTEPLWRALTHQQVWDQVHAGPGPYVSDSAVTAWSNAGSALRQIDSDLDAAITKATGWTGAAADAARSGLTPLGGWAVDATGSAGRAAASLTEHQVQVAWVRANLPEPGPAPAIDPPIPLSDAGVDPAVLQDWTVAVGRNTAVADQAFHVMDTYATNTALIQQQVPAWTPPPAVTVSVAGGPPPSGSAASSPDRAIGTLPATVAPAAAPPVAAAGVAAQPLARGAGQDGNGLGHLPPAPVSAVTPTASGPKEPAAGGRASTSRDGSALPVAGAIVGRTVPEGPGVVPGGPDDAAPPVRGGAGGFDGPSVRTGTGGPSSTGDGVLRGLPDGADTATGVLRGPPGGRSGTLAPPFGQGSPAVGPPRIDLGDPDGGSGGANVGARSTNTGIGYPSGRADLGTGVLGGHQGDPAAQGRGAVASADPPSAFRSTAGAAATGRPLTGGYPGYLPTAGAGLGNRADTHRTPDYLVGTYAFFADERRLAGPVITPEEPLPLRT